MEGVTINFPSVEELTFKIKQDGTTVVQFETSLPAGELGRLINLQKQGAMRGMFVSPQAMFDLKFERVDTRADEVRN